MTLPQNHVLGKYADAMASPKMKAVIAAETAKEPKSKLCPGGAAGTKSATHATVPTSFRDGPQNEEWDKASALAAVPKTVKDKVDLAPLVGKLKSIPNLTCEQARAQPHAFWDAILNPHLVPKATLHDNIYFTNGINTALKSAVRMARRLAEFFHVDEIRPIHNTLEPGTLDVLLELEEPRLFMSLLPIYVGMGAHAAGLFDGQSWKDLFTKGPSSFNTQLAEWATPLLIGEAREVAFDYAWLQSADTAEPYRYAREFGETKRGGHETVAWVAALYHAWQHDVEIGIVATSHGTLVTAKGLIAFVHTFPEAIEWTTTKVQMVHSGCVVHRNRYPVLRAILKKYEPHVDMRDPFAVLLGDHDRSEMSSFYKTSPWANLPMKPEDSISGALAKLSSPPTTGGREQTLEWLAESIGAVLGKVTPLEGPVPALSGYHSIMKSYARFDERHFRRDFFGGTVALTRYWPMVDHIALLGNTYLGFVSTQATAGTLDALVKRINDDDARADGYLVTAEGVAAQNTGLITGSTGQLGTKAVTAQAVAMATQVVAARVDASAAAPASRELPGNYVRELSPAAPALPVVGQPMISRNGKLECEAKTTCPQPAAVYTRFEVVTDDMLLVLRQPAVVVSGSASGPTITEVIANVDHTDVTIDGNNFGSNSWRFNVSGSEFAANSATPDTGLAAQVRWFPMTYRDGTQPPETVLTECFDDPSGRKIELGSVYDAAEQHTIFWICFGFPAGASATVLVPAIAEFAFDIEVKTSAAIAGASGATSIVTGCVAVVRPGDHSAAALTVDVQAAQKEWLTW